MFEDYNGSFARWQSILAEAEVDFDVTLLAGATEQEIEGYVTLLVQRQQQAV